MGSACRPPLPEDPDPLVTTEPPEILASSTTCSTEDETWTVEASTSAWTGGGRLYWTLDGTYIESHPLPSVGASADGRSDLLRATLGLVADWRDAIPGATTAFLCADAPEGVLWITRTDGQTLSDCAVVGTSTGLLDNQDDVPACDSDT